MARRSAGCARTSSISVARWVCWRRRASRSTAASSKRSIIEIAGILEYELLASRAAIDILLRQIDEVLLAKATFRLRARRHRFGQRHADACLLAGQDLLAIEVAAVGDGFEFIDLQNGLGVPRHVR